VAQAALEKGEIDWNLMADLQVATQMQSSPDYQVVPTGGASTLMLYMNTTDPASAWSDVRMRQALEYAIDKQGIIDAVATPFYQARYNIISGLEYAADLSSITPRKYDAEKAKQLIKEAGHEGLTFNLYINGYFAGNPWDYNQYLAWQEALKAVGLDMKIQVIEMGKMIEMSMNPMPGNDVMSTVMLRDAADPMQTVLNYLREGSVMYVGVQRPKEWPALIDKALHTEDTAEKLSLLVQMEKLAYDDAMVIPIHAGGSVSIMSKNVHDASASMKTGFTAEKNAWLSK